MDTIGKYTLVRVIGEGGMGRVFEATDPIIGRRVAIKTISLNGAIDDEARSRFFREAQAAGQLSHPNLITIHDIGEDGDTPYIVMELLEGLDLNRKIRQERLSYDTKMQIMIDVCEGLAFAHDHAIVHRDIKPANIFVTTSDRVKILDFGLARSALSDVTRTGKILGTPSYMAPEQIRGGDVDHRVDIFATGAVFYELLTGRKAFEGDSVANTLYKVLETQPPPVHQLDEGLPAALSAVIERALAKDRRARFQTSREMLDALKQAHARTSPVERFNLETIPVPAPGAVAPPPVSRRSAVIKSIIVASLVVVGAAGFAAWRTRGHDTGSTAGVVAQPSAAPPAVAPSPPPSEAPIPAPAGNAVAPATEKPIVSATPEKAVHEPAVRKVPTVSETPRREGPPAATPAPPSFGPPAAAAPVQTAPSPPPPTPAAAAPAEPKTAPIQPPVASAPLVASPPPPAAPPAAPPPARVEDNPVAAAQSLLARYRAALESRDIGALKEIWPALSGRQEEAIRSEFEHARAIAVGFDGVDIRPTGSGATVTCRRTYAVTTADGQVLRTATTMSMTLARRDGAWRIDTIRHEVAR